MKISELVLGKDGFTVSQLMRLACEKLGIEFHNIDGSGDAYTKAFAKYELGPKQLFILDKAGIRNQPRPDMRGDLVTLVDESYQEHAPGWAVSNYWNFKRPEGKKEVDMGLEVHAKLKISKKKRGVEFFLRTQSSLISPADLVPHLHMIRALVENEENSHPVVRALDEGRGSTSITWTKLGHGGLVSLGDLFREFAEGSPHMLRLAEWGDVFNPKPFPQHQKPGDVIYLTEETQVIIMEQWSEQKKKYISDLSSNKRAG